MEDRVGTPYTIDDLRGMRVRKSIDGRNALAVMLRSYGQGTRWTFTVFFLCTLLLE